jgi:cellulose synthase/poly-beta-1,6-N-acetylglucosamine synthase-like glycosyltransferase/peptidoglycan/xylan/chitin deacetylase (PgdA/CDA1 family)
MTDEAALRRRIAHPRAHWVLFALLMSFLLASLLADGIARGNIGKSSAPPVVPSAGAGLGRTPSLVDLSSGEVRASGPGRRVAVLTFDDGPDPMWTPKILDVLEENDVPATFFVVGSRVLESPEIARDAVERGFEIGAHTMSHADLGSLPAWRQDLELSLTQTAIEGATSVTTSLLRLPYSSTAAAMSERDLAAARRASDAGYLLSFSDRNSQDWQEPGVDAIVSNATPPAHEGAVILFHDSGGNRQQTVDALRLLIPRLKSKGYEFATVSEAAGLDASRVNRPAEPSRHLRGLALATGMRGARAVTWAVTLLPIPLLVLIVLRTLLLVPLARWHKRRKEKVEAGPPVTPGVSIIVPAYNEEVGIVAAVQSLAASAYPDLELIVVDDGSTDGTADAVEALGLPIVTVIRQPNAGKASALNTGISHATKEIVVTVDGDTLFEPLTLATLVQPFKDPTVGGVSGNTKVGNRRGLLGRWQHIEYVMGFNLDRRTLDVLNCIPTVPGAIGAFRQEALRTVGGMPEDTLAEDTDLTMALNRAGWRVVYEDAAIAWTEAPSSVSSLWKQRYRWSYGTFQCLWKHRGALASKAPLRRAFPYLLAFNVLVPLLSPVVDLFAICGLFVMDPVRVALYWLAFNVVQLAVAIYAFRLDDESPGPLWSLPLQQFFYRQLMYLVIIQSVMSALLGARLRWHKLHRTGDVELPVVS